MTEITDEEKQLRVNFIALQARTAIRYAINEARKNHGPDEAERVKKALHAPQKRLRTVVDYYYGRLLHDYKMKNRYYDDERNCGRDKLAAFTAIAILTFNPIACDRYDGPVKAVATINETLALLFATTVLHSDLRKETLMPTKAKPDQYGRHLIVMRNLMLNFRDLGAEARRRARHRDPVRSTEPLADWIIQSMQLYGLAFGKIDVRL